VERGPQVTGTWRVIALVVGLGWVITAIAMIVLTVTAYARPLTGVALAVAMIDGIPVLTFVRNLSGHLADDTEPGKNEYLLAAISAGLVIVAWALHLAS
jgi:hypothetical protein